MHASRKEERDKQMQDTIQNSTQRALVKTRRTSKTSTLLFNAEEARQHLCVLSSAGLFRVPRAKILYAKKYYQKKRERGWADTVCLDMITLG